ncbi:MAG: hypothetical protein H0X25_16495 [Acidobacteriales bacterium]|nr:hypothetical protein [Terriglobales bacterium]
MLTYREQRIGDHGNAHYPEQDRISALGAELCSLLSAQLELLEADRIAEFSDHDWSEYRTRRQRISELVLELTGMTIAGAAV